MKTSQFGVRWFSFESRNLVFFLSPVVIDILFYSCYWFPEQFPFSYPLCVSLLSTNPFALRRERFI